MAVVSYTGIILYMTGIPASTVLAADGKMSRMSKWLSELLCRHLVWIALETTVVDDPDADYMALTWPRMKCIKCGKERTTNEMKPREQLIVGWDEVPE